MPSCAPILSITQISPPSFRGAAKRRARNPYSPAVVMDSGLAGLRPRPGMTGPMGASLSIVQHAVFAAGRRVMVARHAVLVLPHHRAATRRPALLALGDHGTVLGVARAAREVADVRVLARPPLSDAGEAAAGAEAGDRAGAAGVDRLDRRRQQQQRHAAASRRAAHQSG